MKHDNLGIVLKEKKQGAKHTFWSGAMFLKFSPCAANTEFAVVEQLLVFVISGALVFTVERGRKKILCV